MNLMGKLKEMLLKLTSKLIQFFIKWIITQWDVIVARTGVTGVMGTRTLHILGEALYELLRCRSATSPLTN